MADGLAGVHREELKDKQLLSVRKELRSCRLNGPGTKDRPKYVRYSMKHQVEQSTCPNLRSLQRFCLLSLGGGLTRRCAGCVI
jgi:hypothetical protein